MHNLKSASFREIRKKFTEPLQDVPTRSEKLLFRREDEEVKREER